MQFLSGDYGEAYFGNYPAIAPSVKPPNIAFIRVALLSTGLTF
jgi:hypothetical protein